MRQRSQPVSLLATQDTDVEFVHDGVGSSTALTRHDAGSGRRSNWIDTKTLVTVTPDFSTALTLHMLTTYLPRCASTRPVRGARHSPFRELGKAGLNTCTISAGRCDMLYRLLVHIIIARSGDATQLLIDSMVCSVKAGSRTCRIVRRLAGKV